MQLAGTAHGTVLMVERGSGQLWVAEHARYVPRPIHRCCFRPAQSTHDRPSVRRKPTATAAEAQTPGSSPHQLGAATRRACATCCAKTAAAAATDASRPLELISGRIVPGPRLMDSGKNAPRPTSRNRRKRRPRKPGLLALAWLPCKRRPRPSHPG